MIPFKNLITNNMVKQFSIFFIIMCVSGIGLSFSRDDNEREIRRNQPSLARLERDDLNLPYLRDVRANSRQKGIDARDIRTDFQEIRSELRDNSRLADGGRQREEQRMSIRNVDSRRDNEESNRQTEINRRNDNSHREDSMRRFEQSLREDQRRFARESGPENRRNVDRRTSRRGLFVARRENFRRYSTRRSEMRERNPMEVRLDRRDLPEDSRREELRSDLNRRQGERESRRDDIQKTIKDNRLAESRRGKGPQSDESRRNAERRSNEESIRENSSRFERRILEESRLENQNRQNDRVERREENRDNSRHERIENRENRLDETRVLERRERNTDESRREVSRQERRLNERLSRESTARKNRNFIQRVAENRQTRDINNSRRVSLEDQRQDRVETTEVRRVSSGERQERVALPTTTPKQLSTNTIITMLQAVLLFAALHQVIGTKAKSQSRFAWSNFFSKEKVF